MTDGELAPLGGAPALEAVASGLRRDGSDLALYGGFLINTLTEALPEEMVEVEWKRSTKDRLRGRDGEIVSVGVDLGSKRFRLRRSGVGGRPETTIGHVSGGITMKTDSVTLDAWADQLARSLVDAAGRDAAAADAASRIAIPRGADL